MQPSSASPYSADVAAARANSNGDFVPVNGSVAAHACQCIRLSSYLAVVSESPPDNVVHCMQKKGKLYLDTKYWQSEGEEQAVRLSLVGKFQALDGVIPPHHARISTR